MITFPHNPKKTPEDYLLELFIKNEQIQKIDEFGASAEFELYFYKLKDINKLEMKLMDGDVGVETTLNIMKRELARIKEEFGSNEDIRKYHVRLKRAIQTQYQGRSTTNMTIFEFYTDVFDLMKTHEEKEIKKHFKKSKRTG